MVAIHQRMPSSAGGDSIGYSRFFCESDYFFVWKNMNDCVRTNCFELFNLFFRRFFGKAVPVDELINMTA